MWFLAQWKEPYSTYFVQCPFLAHVTVLETNSTNDSRLISVAIVFHNIQVFVYTGDSKTNVLIQEDCLYNTKITFVLFCLFNFFLNNSSV